MSTKNTNTKPFMNHEDLLVVFAVSFFISHALS